ncbi:hypothetical protein [Tenacibaculum maritimum]|uniref:hypothetical protein n=1 Tax=Tenacibaculum maritimum TaxID=107401 RepID=UPI001E2FC0BC|nr:hypothetical protein [Tenacibaculum maritimum]MCD9583761.1 hypothetical protein [Tenacibaculum maritimum]MCD9610983.1 hypothetical protein [Tenacibaculum maritimum]MCD9619489.1 hypothetical protein [Tenacibaculum maritimum]MCD9626169.1 hypothetical protein [Tenacibaculum maritimum]MCD9629161.1 hypothetical protein [Tenacibaculum maritimum]
MDGAHTAITLKEILLGISDSLNEAQHQLRNATPYDEYGRPNTLYTLPYLDFNLQVETTLEKATHTVSNTDKAGMEREYAFTKNKYSPIMRYRPVSKTTNSKKGDKVTSTISGRFVAIAPNEGLPQLIIEAKPIKTEVLGVYNIEVSVFNSAGEKIPGALVEFNYNKAKTTLINSGVSLQHTTNFVKQGELITNHEGKVFNKIRINTTDYNAKCIIQIDINVGTVITKISIQKY